MSFRKILLQGILLLTFCFSFSLRADGLPGEYLLTQRWRDMIAHHSPLTNPALMTEENYISGRIAFAPILDGEYKHGEVGVTVPVGLYQSAGFTFFFSPEGYVFPGGIDEETGSLIPPVDLGDAVLGLSNTNLLFMFSYAWHFWNKLSVGANVKLAYQTAFGDPAMGFGFDLGLTYRLLRHPIIGDHVVGLSTQNLIPPVMKSKFSDTANSAYASDLKVSWVANYWEKRVESALDIDIKDFLAAANEFKTLDGKTAAKQIEFDINFKVGVWLLRMLKAYLQFGFNQKELDYWGMALGVNMPSVNNGRDLEVLYQYNIMTSSGNDATGHTVYLRGDFGKHREEVFARRMARLSSLSPNELYNRARKLYAEQKYWDAFFVFSRILVEFPDFFKNDWVQHYRASCEEELDMREVAIKNYQTMKSDFPLSSAVPYTDLGLMRIYYRNGDFSNVTNQFVELSKPNVPDSLRFHGAYLMGQAHMENNEIAKAVQVFSLIPEEHPDYPFAQHAIAICHARLGDDTTAIVTALENTIAFSPKTEAQKEIINRSYLFMGYLFYEENTLSKAVVALRMVPTQSYYAEDALLGQGWTALKSRQWTDCITIGQLLQKTTKKTILQCEGLLIEAYGYLLQKQYGQSLELLKTASEKIRTAQPLSEDTLNYERMQYESNRVSHNFLADKIDNFSLAGQSAMMASQTDSLRNEHNSYIKKFGEYFNFSTEFKRSAFFSRTIDQIREDVDYALATVQKIVGRSDVNKEQQKMDSQQQQIDSEIEKLKKEMERLQKEAE